MTLEPHTLDEGAEMPLYQHHRAPDICLAPLRCLAAVEQNRPGWSPAAWAACLQDAPESRFHVFTASAVRFYSCKAYIPVVY